MTPTLLRGFFLIALVSLFGALLSLAVVAPVGLPETGAARRRLDRLALWSGLLALGFGILWAVVVSVTIAGVVSMHAALAAVVSVTRETWFGHVMLIRIVLLLAAVTFLTGRGRRRGVALLLAGAALVMQGMVGHAGAIGGETGAVLLVSEVFHLLGAGAWLGGLLPLLLLVRALPPRVAATACDRFFPVGLGAVVAIAGSAGVQGWLLIGSFAGLSETPYGQIALLKLAILVLLLALAALNRLVLTRRLRQFARPSDGRFMQVSLALEALLGAAIIVAAAFLSSGAPAIDAMR